MTIQEPEPRQSPFSAPEPSPAVRGRMAAAGGEETTVVWHVPEEAPVAVLINSTSFAVMMLTPVDLEDFAIGFALTEGIARRAADIHDIRIGEAADGYLLNLVMDPARAAAAERRRRTIPGRSGCGICGAQTLGAALPRLPHVSGPPPYAGALRRAFADLPAAQRINAKNRSSHAAAFCSRKGEIRLLREDIGRHNALDKLVGAITRGSIAPAAGFVVLSSRISVEMVQKAAVIGIPFLAALSGPSALALRQAGQAGMGLASCSRDEVMIFETGSIGSGAG